MAMRSNSLPCCVSIRGKGGRNLKAKTNASPSFIRRRSHFSYEWTSALSITASPCRIAMTNLANELRRLLGDAAVADDPETLTAHSGDKWFAAETPEVVVFARSTSDVSQLLKFASEH